MAAIPITHLDQLIDLPDSQAIVMPVSLLEAQPLRNPAMSPGPSDTIRTSRSGKQAAAVRDQAQHTPGPWIQGEHGYFYGGPHSVICRLEYPSTMTCDQILGNARLIAAAPELLAALGYMQDYLRLAPVTEPNRYALAKVSAAIEKATGVRS